MILYVNGDSHCAGAEAINPFCFAEDDPKYVHMNRRPHPDNLEVSFGKKLALTLNCGFSTDAESASSNDRILRTTQNFINAHNSSLSNYFLLIGWSTPEREEWLHNGDYYQVNASGVDSVPEELEQQYKTYVASCDQSHYHQKTIEWSDKIFDFHQFLKQSKIKHLFFDTFVNLKGNHEYGPHYVKETYFDYLKSQGYKTKHVGSYHFGKDGHLAWARNLLPYLQSLI